VIWRVLAALGGLVLGGLWFLGSGLALGLAECPPEARSGLCAPRHEDLLAALEIALVIGGTIVALAGGLLSARTGRPHWLLGAVAVLGVLGLCSDVVLAGQEQPPG
jgi:hypothetical protein